MMEKERESSFLDYLAASIRYATQYSGLKDWSKGVVVLNELMFYGGARVLEFPCFCTNMQTMVWDYVIIFPADRGCKEERAMRAIIEYQDMYDATWKEDD